MRRSLVRSSLPFGLLGLTLAVLLGIFSGVGSYTFDYAEGTSYFSTNPAACANCHIMNDQYASWSKSGHHHVAGCVDCHLPHDFVRKYIAKGENGYHHSTAFTFQNFHEPIQITPKNARILQESCLRCHGASLVEMLDAIKLASANGATGEQLKPALDLHRKAQWRLDFVAAENSMGFHAPQEAARILAESIDYARQAQLVAQRLLLQPNMKPATQPGALPEGITPTERSPTSGNPGYPDEQMMQRR